MYHVVLSFQDRKEVRLTDRPPELGSTIDIAGSRWVVDRHEPGRNGAADRYVCVALPAASDQAGEQAREGYALTEAG
jgi:hypothetical protein